MKTRINFWENQLPQFDAISFHLDAEITDDNGSVMVGTKDMPTRFSITKQVTSDLLRGSSYSVADEIKRMMRYEMSQEIDGVLFKIKASSKYLIPSGWHI